MPKEPPRQLDYLSPIPPSKPWTTPQIIALTIAYVLVVGLILAGGFCFLLHRSSPF